MSLGHEKALQSTFASSTQHQAEMLAEQLVGDTAASLQLCLEEIFEDSVSSSSTQTSARWQQLLLRLHSWASATLQCKLRSGRLAALAGEASCSEEAIVLDERLLRWFTNELTSRHPVTSGLSLASWLSDLHHIRTWQVLVEALRSWVQTQAKLVVFLGAYHDPWKEAGVERWELFDSWRDWWRRRALPALWQQIAETCLQFFSWLGLGNAQTALGEAWSMVSAAERQMAQGLFISFMERLLLLLAEILSWDQAAGLSDDDHDPEIPLEDERSIYLSSDAWSEALTRCSSPLGQGILTLFAFAAARAPEEPASLNLALTSMEVVRMQSRLHRSCWVNAMDANRFGSTLVQTLLALVRHSTGPANRTFYSITCDTLVFDVLHWLLRSHGADALDDAPIDPGLYKESVHDLWDETWHRGRAWLESPAVIDAVVEEDFEATEPAQERIAYLTDSFLEMWESLIWQGNSHPEISVDSGACAADQLGQSSNGERAMTSASFCFSRHALLVERSQLLVEHLLLHFLPRYASTLIERHGMAALRSMAESRCAGRLTAIASLLRFVTRPDAVPKDLNAPSSAPSSGLRLIQVLEDVTNEALAQWQMVTSPHHAASGALVILLLLLLGELIGDQELGDDRVLTRWDPSAIPLLDKRPSEEAVHWCPWLEALLLPSMRLLATVAEALSTAVERSEASCGSMSMISAVLWKTANRWFLILGPGADPMAAASCLSSSWLLSPREAAQLSTLLATRGLYTLLGFDESRRASWRLVWLRGIHQVLVAETTLASTDAALTSAVESALTLLRRLARSWPPPESLSVEVSWWQQLTETCSQLDGSGWHQQQQRWRPVLVRGLGECLGWAFMTLSALDEADIPGIDAVWIKILRMWSEWIDRQVLMCRDRADGVVKLEEHIGIGVMSPPSVALDTAASARACYVLNLLRGLARVLQKIQTSDAVESLAIITASESALASFSAIGGRRSRVPRKMLRWLADLAGIRMLPLSHLVTTVVNPVLDAVMRCWRTTTEEAGLAGPVPDAECRSRFDELVKDYIALLKLWRALLLRCQELDLTANRATSSPSQPLPSWFIWLWQNGMGSLLRKIDHDNAKERVLLVPRLQEELSRVLADAAWLDVSYEACLTSSDRLHLRNVLLTLMVHGHSSRIVRNVAEAVSRLSGNLLPLDSTQDPEKREGAVALARPPVHAMACDRESSFAFDGWLPFIAPILARLLTSNETSSDNDALIDALYQLLRGTRCTEQALQEQFARLPWTDICTALGGSWAAPAVRDYSQLETEPKPNAAAPGSCLVASQALYTATATERATVLGRCESRVVFRPIARYWIRVLRIEALSMLST
jgi:hypothetical protein